MYQRGTVKHGARARDPCSDIAIEIAIAVHLLVHWEFATELELAIADSHAAGQVYVRKCI
jgi:hypothetical protein